MIIVFGAVYIEIPLSLQDFSLTDFRSFAGCRGVTAGGRAASQAMSAANYGADVILVAKVGDDEFSAQFLSTLRKAGVKTTGVYQSMLPTGMKIIMSDSLGRKKEIWANGANEDLDPDNLPEDLLSAGNVILMQTETPMDANIRLLEKARQYGARSVMNLAPAIKLSQKALDHLDYLIVNYEEAKKLAGQIGIIDKDDSLKLAKGLAKQGNLTCIVTRGANGSVAYTPDDQNLHVSALQIGEIVDRAGAEDAYCGTFAASLQLGMKLKDAMKRASIAASLSCTKEGTIKSFPTIQEVNEHIDKL